jgi:hypothetical protein
MCPSSYDIRGWDPVYSIRKTPSQLARTWKRLANITSLGAQQPSSNNSEALLSLTVSVERMELADRSWKRLEAL